MPRFRTLGEAALYAEDNNHPASWVRPITGGGYIVNRPHGGPSGVRPATKKRKKTTRKKATRKKTTRKKATRKKATRKKTTRKKATRKKASKKRSANSWGQSVVGTTPRATFFRSQKRSGASKKQAAARWKLGHSRKKSARKR